MKSNFPRVNLEIKVELVRLIDESGHMQGITPIYEALEQAKKVGLDLVEISPTATPPVCKILDFSKFRFEAKKKVQAAKKKQKVTEVKEMKFKPNIGQGDLDTKLRKIREFLANEDKVKISLMFKGREIVHQDIGMQLFDRIILALQDVAKIEAEPKMEGKQIIMVISPIINKAVTKSTIT